MDAALGKVVNTHDALAVGSERELAKILVAINPGMRRHRFGVEDTSPARLFGGSKQTPVWRKTDAVGDAPIVHPSYSEKAELIIPNSQLPRSPASIRDA